MWTARLKLLHCQKQYFGKYRDVQSNMGRASSYIKELVLLWICTSTLPISIYTVYLYYKRIASEHWLLSTDHNKLILKILIFYNFYLTGVGESSDRGRVLSVERDGETIAMKIFLQNKQKGRHNYSIHILSLLSMFECFKLLVSTCISSICYSKHKFQNYKIFK